MSTNLEKGTATADLLEDVQARKRREILDWVGKVDYFDDYDLKRLRDRKRAERSRADTDLPAVIGSC